MRGDTNTDPKMVGMRRHNFEEKPKKVKIEVAYLDDCETKGLIQCRLHKSAASVSYHSVQLSVPNRILLRHQPSASHTLSYAQLQSKSTRVQMGQRGLGLGGGAGGQEAYNSWYVHNVPTSKHVVGQHQGSKSAGLLAVCRFP